MLIIGYGLEESADIKFDSTTVQISS